MRRFHQSLGMALACLAVAGMFNWVTTCCCGRSLVLELLEGGCCSDSHEHEGGMFDCGRDHGHAVHHLPGHHSDGCHKHGSENYVPSAEERLSGPDLTLVQALPSAPAAESSFALSSSGLGVAISSSGPPAPDPMGAVRLLL